MDKEIKEKDRVGEEKITIDDMFAQSVSRTSVEIMGDIGSTLEEWMENDPLSFKRFPQNCICGAEGKNFRARLLFDENREEGLTSAVRVPLCAASLKSLGFKIEDICPRDPTAGVRQTLFIYGHTEDREDAFGSRLDKKLTCLFPDDFITKFDSVELSGCFASVEEMRDVIMTLYKRLTGQMYMNKVALHLDSTVKDDDGKWRTVADLIHSGYIEPSVVRVTNIVEYVFARLDPGWTEMLYDAEYKEEEEETMKLI